MKDKMYILVNEDIKISKGKLAGQVGHAVASYMFNTLLNSSRGAEMDNELTQLSKYMKEQKKVILKCSEERLRELEENTECFVIRDKGLTHLAPNTLTCVNVGLYNDSNVPEWIRELKLY